MTDEWASQYCNCSIHDKAFLAFSLLFAEIDNESKISSVCKRGFLFFKIPFFSLATGSITSGSISKISSSILARYFNAFNKHAEALPSKDVVLPVIICPSLSSIANPGSLVFTSISNA